MKNPIAYKTYAEMTDKYHSHKNNYFMWNSVVCGLGQIKSTRGGIRMA